MAILKFQVSTRNVLGLLAFLNLCQLADSGSFEPKPTATVGIFTQCGDGSHFNKIIANDRKTKVIIDSWYPPSSLSCVAVFRAEEFSQKLYYQLKSISIYSSDVQIKIETKSGVQSYKEIDIFDQYNQEIKGKVFAGTYIRITATRLSTSAAQMYMNLELFSDEFIARQSRVYLSIAEIIGIALGVVLCLIILITVIACCCIHSRKQKRRNKGVIMTTDTRNAHVDIPMIGTPAAYPYSPPPEPLTSHPGYPTYQLNQGDFQPPPAYSPTVEPIDQNKSSKPN